MLKGRRILYLLLVGFFFLVAFQEFLHNHQPALSDHTNCPVFILHQVIHYTPDALIVVLIVCLLALFNCSLVDDAVFKNRLLLYTLGSRGPPFLR